MSEVISLLHDLIARVTRVESRLVQLMIHQGLDPYRKTYEGNEDRDGSG
jgi:hypothetical protein